MRDTIFEDLRGKDVEYGVEKVRIYTKGWSPRWTYSYERGEVPKRTTVITPWEGATRISKKRVGKSLNSIYYDGVRVDVLEENTANPYDLDLRLNCLTYPDILENLIGLYETPGVKHEASVLNDTFSLSYQTRVSSGGYKIHYYPAVKATPTEITYSTMSNLPEPVEFAFDLAVISPKTFRSRGITALGFTFNTEELSNALTNKIEKTLYEDATNIDSLLDEVDVATRNVPKFEDNGDGTWSAWVDEEYSAGFYDLKPVPPLGEEFSISASQDESNPQYIDEYTWTVYNSE